MKSNFIRKITSSMALGLSLSLFATSTEAASDNELRIRCESKRDANACLEVGLNDSKKAAKDKVHRKSAQRELKKACSIQMNRPCSREETIALARAFRENRNRIPANTNLKNSIRAPKITTPGKRVSTGAASMPAYEPPPMPEPPAPVEPPFIPPPPPPMPPPPAAAMPGQCMPGDASCMQQPMGQ